LTRAPARIAQSHQLGGKRPAGRRLGIVWDISMLSRVYRSGDFCLPRRKCFSLPELTSACLALFSPQRNLSSSFFFICKYLQCLLLKQAKSLWFLHL
jgi:hypothetical protein